MYHSGALRDCKHRPGWLKGFLAAVRNGYSDLNSAKAQGISTQVVKKYLEANTDQMEIYNHNRANATKRTDGRW